MSIRYWIVLSQLNLVECPFGVLPHDISIPRPGSAHQGNQHSFKSFLQYKPQKIRDGGQRSIPTRLTLSPILPSRTAMALLLLHQQNSVTTPTPSSHNQPRDSSRTLHTMNTLEGMECLCRILPGENTWMLYILGIIRFPLFSGTQCFQHPVL